MPRIARIVAVGLPHHITQRGNYQQEVFLSEEDRLQYLAWIKEYSTKYSLSILVYSLMQNHVHFIAIPKEADSLARTFNSAHMRYSQYVNRKRRQRGHLWQGRFYSCVLDESHLILASRYIERNPVRAGLVEKPWEWPWSSALAHAEGGKDSLVEPESFLGVIDMPKDSWKEYIDCVEKPDFLHSIRKHTLTGWPLGTRVFIEKLEAKFERKLCASPVGRPIKS